MYPWQRLWTIDVATKAANQLTRGELHVSDFTFSPDGKRLAFAGQPTPLIPDQWQSDVYVIAAGGGEPRRIVERKGLDTSPSWSPDGKWIAFVSQDGGDREWYTNNYVCLVSPEGGAVRNITKSLDERIGGLGRAPASCGAADSTSVVFPSLQKTGRPRVPRHPRREGRGAHEGAGDEHRTLPRPQGRRPSCTCARTRSTRGRSAARALPAGAPKALTDTNPQVRDLLPFAEGARHLEGSGRAGRWTGCSSTRRATRRAARVPLLLNVHGGPAGTHSNTFSAKPPLRLAAPRPGGLRRLLPEPARQRRLRREVPRRQRARLGRQGLRGHHDRRGRARGARRRGQGPPRRLRLVVRRLHDLDHRDQDRPLQGGGGGRGRDPSLVLHGNDATSPTSRAPISGPGRGRTRRSTSTTRRSFTSAR